MSIDELMELEPEEAEKIVKAMSNQELFDMWQVSLSATSVELDIVTEAFERLLAVSKSTDFMITETYRDPSKTFVPNRFGNYFRFTDENGNESNANDYKIDHMSGYGDYKIDKK